METYVMICVMCAVLFTWAMFNFILLLVAEKEKAYLQKFLVEKKRTQEYEEWKNQRKLQLRNINPLFGQ